MPSACRWPKYAQAKIVEPAGFAGGLFWMVDPRPGNIGGLLPLVCACPTMPAWASSCSKAARGPCLKAGSPKRETARSISAIRDFGYGYQWWTYPGGNFGAQGIFGQGINLVPERGLVVAYVGNWSRASGGPERRQLLELTGRIAAEAE